MKHFFLFLMLALSFKAFASHETGSQDQIYRIPHGGGRAQFGSIDLTKSATVGSSVLGIANGGTNNGSLGVTAGGVLYTDGSKAMNMGAGTSGQVLESQAGSAPVWETLLAPSVTVLSAGSGTYSTPTGAKMLEVIVIGPGGGGGGVASTGTSQSAAAGGGGGGGTVVKWISNPSATFTYVVGTGGGGGAAGANGGSTGSAASSFTDGSTITLTAGAGSGGNGSGAGGGPVFMTGYISNGGTATGGDLNIPGGAGQPGLTLQNGSQAAGGGGGGTMYCPAQVAMQNLGSSAGTAATCYGGGGGGAVNGQSSSAHAGGNGFDGRIIVKAFYQ